LMENPDLAHELEEKIRSNSGLVDNIMMNNEQNTLDEKN